jgi:hypothetical protein
MKQEPTLERRIDELYKGSIDEFVPARNALAKTLEPPQALRVRQLRKPGVTAWAVNQVYWHEQSAYARLLESGKALRQAQLAALKTRGRASAQNLRDRAAAHRAATSAAVTAASRLAAARGVKTDAEDLMRTFEALSAHPSEQPGRLTKAMQPAGFEALAGVTLRPLDAALSAHATKPSAVPTLEQVNRERERARLAADRRKHQAVKQAETLVARARNDERRARDEWERAKNKLETAERALAHVREGRAPAD